MSDFEVSASVPHLSSVIPWHQRAGFDVQEFSANGVRTFAVVEGRHDSFPVIFLHGFPGGAFLWEYIIAALGRRRLAIAPDFPGWGKSVSPHEELPPASSKWCLEWMKGLFAAQHVHRFDLVAHGSACWLAMEMMAYNSGNVRRLALIAPRLWPHSLRARKFRHTWTQKRVAFWLSHRADLRPETARRYEAQFLEMVDPQRRVWRLLKADFRPRSGKYAEVLTSWRGRALLVWGENDTSYGAPEKAELAALLPGPQQHEIASAGHFPMLDQPQIVTPILKEFLED